MKLILLIAALILTLDSSGQNFPEVISKQGKTYVLLTPAQLIFANKMIIERDRYKAMSIVQYKIIESSKKENSLLNNQVKRLSDANELLIQSLKNNSKILDLNNRQCVREVKDGKRKNRNSIVISFLSGIIASLIVIGLVR